MSVDRIAPTEGRRKRLVVKIGSSTLTTSESKVDYGFLASVADQMARVREAGWDPVIVTSAAIACGLEAMGIETRPKDMPSLQAAASVGASVLSAAYDDAFSEYGMRTSLVLLTRRDTADRTAYLHARDTFNRLLELGVVPIVNENDTVSVEQIRFGDNDTLAALVACLIDADLLVIMSDIDGLYDDNPRTNPNAKLIERVDAITPEIIAVAGGVGSSVGSGGMATKIKAARVLAIAGIPMVICFGRRPDCVVDAAAGESVGTRFTAEKKLHEVTAKKLWIALADSPRGHLQVDDGAKAALVAKGSSLLSVGVRAIDGRFEVGDIVDITDGTGRVFARGRVRASADLVELAIGRSRADLRGNAILRQLADQELVHRDELVVFE